MNEHIICGKLDIRSNSPSAIQDFKVFHEAMEFLLSLCGGKGSQSVLNLLSSSINIVALKSLMISIYQNNVLKEMWLMRDDKVCGDDDCFDHKCKYAICNLDKVSSYTMLKMLSDKCTDTPELDYFTDEGNYFDDLRSKFFSLVKKSIRSGSDKKRDSRVLPVNIYSGGRKGKDMKTYLSLNIVNGKFQEEDQPESVFADEEVEESLEITYDIEIESKRYFRKLIGSVEIVKDDEISKLYYKKPLLSLFATSKIKEDIIFKTPRSTDQERLSTFVLNHITNYKNRMLTRRVIDRRAILRFFLNYWFFLKDVSLLLVLFINIFFLITYRKDENDKVKGNFNVAEGDQIIQGVTIIQILISIAVLFGCGLEQYSEVIFKLEQQDGGLSRELDLLNIDESRSIYNRFLDFLGQALKGIEKYMRRTNFVIFLHFLNPDNAYNLLYLAVSIIGFFFPLVYSLILLDIIKRSDVLQNVIRAITTNIKQLVLTLLLGIVVIYLFSIVAFLQLAEFYKGNLIPDRLYLAFATTINYGLRAGGGIGDSLVSRTLTSNKYWNAYAFELAFFIIVNMLFLNIIFGIIIDSFGALRDQKSKNDQECKEKCFICGIHKNQFENIGKKFSEHIILEHNIFDYLNFIIYIEEKLQVNCNGVEKFVKDKLKKKEIDFLPIGRAISLNSKE